MRMDDGTIKMRADYRMTIPTDEELRRAYDAIDKDGPGAEWTLRLSMLALKHPVVKRWLDNVTPFTSASRPVIMAALVMGLNFGLRIGEERCRKIEERR